MPGIGPIVINTGAAAPDRRVFRDLKAELARGSNPDDETTLAIAGDAINSGIRAYNRYLWPWELLAHQATLATNDDTVPLPQSFKAPCSAHLLLNGRKWKRLGYMPYETYLAEYDLTATGEPRLYTLRNQFESGEAIFWPRPMSAYTAEINYYRRTPTLRNDDDPIDLPSEAEEAVMAWAWYEFVKRLGGEFAAGKLGSALAEAQAARAELVALVALRGDVAGVV